MSIVLANWKAAFLRVKVPLPFMVVLALLLGLWLLNHGDRWSVLGILAASVAVSSPLSSMQSEIMARPFSFCLPGYRESLCKAVLCDAVFAGLAISLLGSQLAEERTPWAMGLWALGSFWAGSSLFVFGATCRLIPALVIPVLDVILSLPFCLAALLVLAVILLYPPVLWLVAFVVCAVIDVFVWVRFADGEAVLQAHRDIVTDAIKRRGLFVMEKPAYARVERFFFDRMESCRHLGAGRFIWGYLYCTFRRVLSPSKWWAVPACVAALVLGYAGRRVTEFTFVALSLPALVVPLPVTFDLPLPAGRGERRYGTIVAVAVTTSLLMIVTGGVAAISWLLSLFVPPIPLEVADLPYVGISLWSACLPCLLVPWLFVLRLLGRRLPILITAAGYSALLFILAVVGYPNLLTGMWRGLRDPIVLASLLVGGWMLLLLVLGYASMRWDLLTQSPRLSRIVGAGK